VKSIYTYRPGGEGPMAALYQFYFNVIIKGSRRLVEPAMIYKGKERDGSGL